MSLPLYEYILYAFFPRRCPLCNTALPPDMPMCEKCESELHRIEDDVCRKCARVKDDCICDSQRMFFEAQTAPFYYLGSAKRSVRSLKFENKTQNAYGLGEFMAQCVKKHFEDVEFDFVCCVPLSEQSLDRRGYNQSALLAKEVARRLKLPFEEKLLSRPFHGKEQKTLGGIERFGGVIGSFDCRKSRKLQNATVLLCDDISTTGATLNECAKMLLLQGADRVYCVSAAITKKED